MTISRRTVVRRRCAGALAPRARAGPRRRRRHAGAPKVLRYAFDVAETSFDPVKINDLYSRTLTPHIFEALYTYDHLARPVKIMPLTADGMPRGLATTSASGRCASGPASISPTTRRSRASGASWWPQDYVYAFKRFADPANKSPVWSGLETEGFLGLNELRQRALRRARSRSTTTARSRAFARSTATRCRFSVKEPRPRFLESLAASDLFGAVAREVIEFYGDQAEAHPVGTGPFRLAQWRRSSLIVLERNPDFREMLYDAEPAADDAEGQAIVERFKGRRLPMIDRVEVSIIEEEQPRWLAFVNGEADVAYRVGYQFAPQAMPNGQVAPNLAKRGIRGFPIAEAATQFYLFNMDDPVVGGYSAGQVALRRAIGLGIDAGKIIAYAYNGLGTVSQGPTLPQHDGVRPER